MRALIYDGQLRIEQDQPTPSPENDQALLKIRQAGICNTDLELVRGYKSFSGILGHEFVAEVVQGPVEWVGKRVVGEINVACGECEFCKRDIPSHCSNRSAVGIFGHSGAFADYLALTTKNLHFVPDNVSDDAAVFVEPLAAALQVIESTHISPRNRVIIIGAGKLGLLTAQVVRLTGADVLVIARREKQQQLLEQWGIPAVKRGDLADNMADVVVDCTGTEQGFADALNLVKARGTIILKSTYADIPQADLIRVVVNEIRVIGSRCGSFGAALRLLSANLIDTESLIEARYSIDQGLEAMHHSSKSGVLKVLLDL